MPGLKQKDLIGIPWRVAFALQADGWYLRQDIIWHKPNPMPESVTDRCTKAHEHIFLLSKSERYYFDNDAIKEPLARPEEGKRKTPAVFGGRDKFAETKKQSRLHSGNEYTGTIDGKRNRRSVWTVTTKPFKGAHFAAFPPDLIQPCILAGCPRGGIVLDPFGGAGTTGLVSERLLRGSILIELNPDYCQMVRDGIRADGGKVECALPEAKRDSGPLFEDAAE
jgi:DNA modification methylase